MKWESDIIKEKGINFIKVFKQQEKSHFFHFDQQIGSNGSICTAAQNTKLSTLRAHAMEQFQQSTAIPCSESTGAFVQSLGNSSQGNSKVIKRVTKKILPIQDTTLGSLQPMAFLKYCASIISSIFFLIYQNTLAGLASNPLVTKTNSYLGPTIR